MSGLFYRDLLCQGGAEISYNDGAIRFMGVSIPCGQIHLGKCTHIRKIGTASQQNAARKNFSSGARRQVKIHDARLAVYKYKLGDIV